MKVLLVVTLALLCLATALPSDIFDFEGDNAEHEQDGEAGKSVTGEYKWESPEGLEFYVSYIADDKGYRVVDSNAVPSFNDLDASGRHADLDGDEDEGSE